MSETTLPELQVHGHAVVLHKPPYRYRVERRHRLTARAEACPSRPARLHDCIAESRVYTACLIETATGVPYPGKPESGAMAALMDAATRDDLPAPPDFTVGEMAMIASLIRRQPCARCGQPMELARDRPASRTETEE